VQVQSNKRKIRQLEDELLARLSASSGNLLDDTELVAILATTKQTAQVDEAVVCVCVCGGGDGGECVFIYCGWVGGGGDGAGRGGSYVCWRG
jgi:hypothetical protein